MIRDIKIYGDPILRKKCDEVTSFDASLKEIVKDLLETLSASPTGVGLAAPQVGIGLRIFVIGIWDYDKDGKVVHEPPVVYINPKILSYSEEEVSYDEGCLSIPRIYYSVKRPRDIVIQAQDENGNVFQQELTGYHARAFLHENDHLNGVLFIDRLPPRIRKSLDKDLHKIKKK